MIPFNNCSDSEKERIVQSITECFKEAGFKCKTMDPLCGMFGKYNCIAYIEHPAFVSKLATVAVFDGLSSNVKLCTGLSMLYGGLSFDRGEMLIQYDHTSTLSQELYQLKLIIKAIRNEPMDIQSRRYRGEERE